MAERKNGDGCKGCIYRKKFGRETGFCDYFGVTGELRGCAAGEGCTHYKKTSRGKRLRKYLAEF